MADWIDIADLHPTQLTLGYGAVAARKAKLSTKTDAELGEHLRAEKRRVPHVVGPGGRIYMTDHHHLARALWERGWRRMVLGEKLHDFSDFDPADFWRKMDAVDLCWPVDAEGNRRPFASIPDHVEKLGDNPWRTLARNVVDEAFVNDDTAFQEFMWGEYFRSFMTRRLVDEHPDLAAKLAKEVALLPDARDLAGYKGYP